MAPLKKKEDKGASGTTQDTMEGIYFLTILGMPVDPQNVLESMALERGLVGPASYVITITPRNQSGNQWMHVRLSEKGGSSGIFTYP